MPLISLVGLPGSGKSTIGKGLAATLGTSFIDCDATIEAAAGHSVAEIFARHGEASFRQLEAETIERITRESEGVLATGGGAILDSQNRGFLRERSTVIYLNGTPADIASRLTQDGSRPLFAGSHPLTKLHQLFDERDPLYRASAHWVVDIGGADADAVVDRVMRRLAEGQVVG